MNKIGFMLICSICFCFNLALCASNDVRTVALYFYSPLHNSEQIVSSNGKLINFIKDYPTKVLIHGFIANRFHGSIEPVKNAYLAKGDVNLVIADWEEAAHKAYDESRALVHKVGNRIGEILTDLIRSENIDLKDMHIIGHSLGAHIAGNVGRYFRGGLGRITGLDPAAPLFFKWSPDAIKKSDGQFVDVIHTCAQVLGEIWVRGHADFYPNSGTAPQPGCRIEDIKKLFSCSHFRAPQFFAESILIKNAFLSSECSTIEEILNDLPDKCSSVLISPSEQVFMGDNISNKVRGIYYLTTNELSPFGKGNFSEKVTNLEDILKNNLSS